MFPGKVVLRKRHAQLRHIMRFFRPRIFHRFVEEQLRGEIHFVNQSIGVFHSLSNDDIILYSIILEREKSRRRKAGGGETIRTIIIGLQNPT